MPGSPPPTSEKTNWFQAYLDGDLDEAISNCKKLYPLIAKEYLSLPDVVPSASDEGLVKVATPLFEFCCSDRRMPEIDILLRQALADLKASLIHIEKSFVKIHGASVPSLYMTHMHDRVSFSFEVYVSGELNPARSDGTSITQNQEPSNV